MEEGEENEDDEDEEGGGWVGGWVGERGTRMTNMSPRPWSKTISIGTRESEQPRMATDGCCGQAHSYLCCATLPDYYFRV